jgi:predicted regulator of Ras-like GTPase activity (Roadblock/LC7/MglB family)
MESVLGQLITVPGVVGGMIYDGDGRLLSKAFPPIFDEAILASAARVLVDGAAGLETVTGTAGLIDLRFADARVVVRPMAGANLVLLCAAQTNLQLLNISTSVAVPKIERLVASLPSGAAELAAGDAGAAEGAAPAEPAPPPSPAEAKPSGDAPAEDDPGLFHW